MSSLIRAKQIFKSYGNAASKTEVLRGLDLEVTAGESVAIIGSSGSGKSTFLQILGSLERPDSGSLSIDHQDILALPADKVAEFRNLKMGFVFQFHHLLAELNVLQNVLLPCQIAGDLSEKWRTKATEALFEMGMDHRMEHYPNQLSGGELQRVAIARALIKDPLLLLADEPTGNLDSANAKRVQDLFFELQRKRGLTLVVVTHDVTFAHRFDRVLRMQDGMWATPGR